MRKWTVPSLMAALFLAVVLRLEPLLKYDIWGSDTGEYFALVQGIVDRGYISTAYWGWGMGYPFFPGAEVLVGGCSIVTGLDALTLLKLLLPILGSFTTVIAFMIGWTAFRDERAGLIAAGFMAVAMPHVFATSHPMPGTLGDLLAAVCILLYLKVHEDRMALLPLTLASVALVPTHHLSAFFVLVPVLFASFMRELLRPRQHPIMGPVDVFYIAFMLAANLEFWLGVAVPFREEVMTEAFGVHPFVIAAAAIGMLFVALLVIKARRAFMRFRYTPRLPTWDRCLRFAAVNMAVLLGFFVFIALAWVPGTSIEVDPAQMLLLVPTAVFFGLAIVGVTGAEISRRGLFVWLWFAACTILFIISIATNNTVLMSYRIFEYIALPAAVMAGWGISYMAGLRLESGPGVGKGKRTAVAIALVGLLLASAATAYPPKELLGGFEEGTVTQEMDAVVWAGESIPVRGTLVASDHRMSSMVFGFAGLNATWDEDYWTMHGDLNESRAELRSVKVASGRQRIDYVLLDDQIRAGVAMKQWENARPMSDRAVAKFGQPPFQKVYESNGAQFYFVGEV